MQQAPPVSQPSPEPAHAPPERPPRWREVAALLALLAAAAVAYLPALDAEFQFDDLANIVEKYPIKDLGLYLRGFFLDDIGQRSVAMLTFALDYRLAGGLAVRVFHVTSLCLHLATVVLVYLFTRDALRRAGSPGPWLALLVAAAFALHPIQTQAVTYVVQRAEVLASFFYLATLLLLLRAEERGPSPAGAAAYLGSLAAFALAAGSKPIAVTAPVAFLLHRAWFPAPGQAGARRLWAARVAMVAPMLATAAWLARAQLGAVRGHRDVGFDIPSLGPGRYLLTELRVLLTYLRLLAWPSGQNVDWSYPVSRGPADPATLIGIAGVAGLVAAGALLAAWSRRAPGPWGPAARLASFGVAWFLLVLSPTSSILPIADVLVEHRLYLASWGILAGLGVLARAGALWLAAARPSPAVSLAAPAAALAVLVALGAATWGRNQVWRTRLSLWSDSVSKSPDKARAHANLAYALAEHGDHVHAVVEYRRALMAATDRTAPWAAILRNMGASLLALRRLAEAEDVFRNALAVSPGHPDLLNNLAITLFERGDLAEAEVQVREALARDPHHGGAHSTLGELQARRGDLAGALREFQTASALDPDSALRVVNVARTAERLGMADLACGSWARVLQLARAPPLVVEARGRLQALGCPRPGGGPAP